MSDEEIIDELQEHRAYLQHSIEDLKRRLESAKRDLARCERVLEAMRELQIKQRIFETNKNKSNGED